MIPLLLLLLAALAAAYIPASPTNSTQDAIAGGLNITDISKLRLQWYSNGSVSRPLSPAETILTACSNYVENISYQLAGNGTSGISKVCRCSYLHLSRFPHVPTFLKGILIHFSEESVNETVPPSAHSENFTQLPMLIRTFSICTLDCNGLL